MINEEVNFRDFFSLLNKNKLFIISITSIVFIIVMGLHYFNVQKNNKNLEIKKDKYKYFNTVKISLPYIVFLPKQSFEEEIEPFVRKLIYSQKYLLENQNKTNDLLKEISLKNKMSFSLSSTFIATWKIESDNEKKLQDITEKGITHILDLNKKIDNYKDTKYVTYKKAKVIEIIKDKTKIETINNKKKIKKSATLKMKILVTLVMGLFLAVFLLLLKEKLKKEKL